jgi:adenylate cyclase, class 2
MFHSSPRRNIEIRAKCHDLARVRQLVQALAATYEGVLKQTDTYFDAPHRRVKLREMQGKPAELIVYARANDPAARASDYYIVPVPQPLLLKAALAAALGIRGEVRKRRELYLWHNVRIHLDEVERLGSFLEFEAVLSDPAQEQLSRERLEHLWRAMELRDEDRIAESYSDLAGL